MQVRIDHGAAASPSAPAAPSRDRNRVVRVTDETGRVLGVRAPGVVQRMRLLEAIGPESTRNEAYMSFATLALAVVEIDGMLCEPMASKRQLEARVQQLDEHGLQAAGEGLAAWRAEAAPAGAEDLAKNG